MSSQRRGPAAEANINLRAREVSSSKGLVIDRDFLNSEEIQDVSVCGDLFANGSDFYVRSQCHPGGQGEKYFGLSKIPETALLKTSQAEVWQGWMMQANAKRSASTFYAPFVCYVGRGHGDPCNKKNGSLILRVRRFTSDEEQYKSWK